MRIRRLSLGPFQSNCYLVAADPGPTVVIDPGAEPDRILAALGEDAEPPEAILLTHAHVDHVGAVAALRRAFDAPIYLHPDDRELYLRAADQAAAFGLRVEPPPPPDHELVHGDELRFGSLRFSVRHVPGHSPGGVVLVGEGVAFVGDCVFAGSIGRTDLPGGGTATLLAGIRAQILSLPPQTVLHPGHGPETTVAREAASNPFLTAAGWSG